MMRLAWRQFRTEAVVGLAVLAAVAVVLGLTGPHLVDVFRTAPNQVANTDVGLQRGLELLILLAPALVGLFFGAPLVARELESGTYRLAWTQSVTRARWLVTKLGMVGLASSVLAGGLSLMVAWWFNPINVAGQDRFSPFNFGLFGIVPFGYGLFAFAVGATAGILFRKVIPALATTLAAYAGVRLAVTYWVRPHFESPITRSFSLLRHLASIGFIKTPSGFRVLPGITVPNGWVLSAGIADKAGHAPTTAALNKACPAVANLHPGGGPHAGPATPSIFQHCVAAVATRFHGVVTYQPASRYWPFQAYETALFVALALVLSGFAFWWVRRRLT